MKLYIKQKVFSWRDRFLVKDESGNDRFAAEGEFFTWGDSYELDIADAQNELLCLCVALAVDCAMAVQNPKSG